MKISIVTINFNNKIGLKKTVESVEEQSYKDIEFIIIDGASIDGSVDVIRDNITVVSNYVSEKDKGIYDAMNKGMELSCGDFVVFMNSGDVFYNSTALAECVAMIGDRDKIYFARAYLHNKETFWIHPKDTLNHDNINHWLDNELPSHQAMFFPKIFYKKEKYNLKYKIFSDVDYKYRGKEKIGFTFIDTVLCKFELGGISSKFDNYSDVKKMIGENWAINGYYKGSWYALKRTMIYHLKYMTQLFTKDDLFFKVLRTLRK